MGIYERASEGNGPRRSQAINHDKGWRAPIRDCIQEQLIAIAIRTTPSAEVCEMSISASLSIGAVSNVCFQKPVVAASAT